MWSSAELGWRWVPGNPTKSPTELGRSSTLPPEPIGEIDPKEIFLWADHYAYECCYAYEDNSS